MAFGFPTTMIGGMGGMAQINLFSDQLVNVTPNVIHYWFAIGF